MSGITIKIRIGGFELRLSERSVGGRVWVYPTFGGQCLALGFLFLDPIRVALLVERPEDGVRGIGAIGRADGLVEAHDLVHGVEDGLALVGRKLAGIIGSRGRWGSRGWCGSGIPEVELVLGEVEAALGQVVVEAEFDEVGGRGGECVEMGGRAGDGGVEGLVELARDGAEGFVEAPAEAMGADGGCGGGVRLAAGGRGLHRVWRFFD